MRPLSARNPRVRRLSRLVRHRDERVGERAFVVEGHTLVRLAIDVGADLLEVFVDEVALAERPGLQAIAAQLPDGVDGWTLPAGTLDRLGDAATSQGVLAVLQRPVVPWPTPSEVPFVLVLDEVADPGNVGTLVRAAAASGAGAVVAGGGADPTGPKAVRASAGTILTVPVVSAGSGFEALSRLRALGYRVVATTVREGVPYDEADLSPPLALVVSNEARGASEDVLALADDRLTIPMAGPAESLNVAMAGTVVCFEVLRRSRRGFTVGPP